MIDDQVPMEDGELSDRALLERVHTGDCKATEALIARHRGWATQYVLRLGAGSQAEDIAHDALVRLMSRPPQELRNESLRPLLSVDLRHRVGRAKRRAGRMPAFHPGSSLATPPERARSVSSDVRLLEATEHLNDAMEQLETRDRLLVRWRYLDELKYSEIAERLGKTESAARGGVFRAVESLRRVFGSRGK